jgi:hypothetical protein
MGDNAHCIFAAQHAVTSIRTAPDTKRQRVCIAADRVVLSGQNQYMYMMQPSACTWHPQWRQLAAAQRPA